MIAAVDRFDAFVARHERACDVIAALWLAIGVAINARFITLPDLPFLSERGVFWAGVVINVLWWAVLRPKIERRRKLRAAEPVTHG